jgi:serine/threonine protein kinase
VLPHEFTRDTQFLARFKTEVLNTAKLQHPYIVSVYDVGIDDDTYYYVMQLIEGQDLKSLMSQPDRLSDAVIIKYLEQVANALDFAHANGIIHRDIKPENILIDKYGIARVTDFGIARSLEGTRMTSGMIGTPEYMSPEQAQGNDVDGRSDQYSLAIVAYEMFTGTTPFRSSSSQPWAVVNKHINEVPPDPCLIVSSLTSYCAAVLLKGLAKIPDKRFGSCMEFIDFFSKPGDNLISIPNYKPLENESYSYTVQLIDYLDIKKILTIKTVREDTGWSLKEAKDAVESLPTEIRSGIQWFEAKSLIERYESIGCHLLIYDTNGKEHYRSTSVISEQLPGIPTVKVKTDKKSSSSYDSACILMCIGSILLIVGLSSLPYWNVTVHSSLETLSENMIFFKGYYSANANMVGNIFIFLITIFNLIICFVKAGPWRGYMMIILSVIIISSAIICAINGPTFLPSSGLDVKGDNAKADLVRMFVHITTEVHHEWRIGAYTAITSSFFIFLAGVIWSQKEIKSDLK